LTKACILGLSGPTLSAEERAFFTEVQPLGFILFRRNVDTPDQVRALTESLRSCVDHDAMILIDQEGGRVRRLRPPHWPDYPPAALYRAFARSPEEERELVRLGARLMAYDLRDLGINVDCAPVMDLPQPGAHHIIGDRAYGTTREDVAVMGRAACEGFLAGGVLPIIKHIPGHGRAGADSHASLPVVESSFDELLASDFYPFQICADMPLAMTAHVLYRAIDRKKPATTSKKAIRVIRDVIGFDGVIVCDDLSMNALSGALGRRARESVRAGCDVLLHCNGSLPQMSEVVAETPKLKSHALRRTEAAFRRLLKTPEPLDLAAARLRFITAVGRLDAVKDAADPTEFQAQAV